MGINHSFAFFISLFGDRHYTKTAPAKVIILRLGPEVIQAAIPMKQIRRSPIPGGCMTCMANVSEWIQE